MKSFQNFLLTEAINNANADRAAHLIQTYLTKKVKKPFYRFPDVEQYKSATDRGYGIRYFFGTKDSVRFNWRESGLNSSALASIDIWHGKDNSWHIEFDRQMSLVQVLPIVADLLKVNKAGLRYYSLVTSLNEDVVLTEQSEMLEEAWKRISGDDLYDSVVSQFADGAVIDVNQFVGSAYVLVYNPMKKKYPNYFDKWSGDRRKSIFVGDPEFFIKNYEQVMQEIGRVKVKITRGPKKETYAPSPEVVDIENNKERIAFEVQLKDLEKLTRMVIAGVSNALFIAGRGGIGKALAHGTLVLTPDGWEAIENIQEGDMVIAQDGSPTLVSGVFPQGKRETYQVNFSDGRQSIVDGDHLWEVSVEGKTKVLTTKEISNLIEANNLDRRITIPLYSPAKTEDVDLPIDPYIIGILLGDGSLTSRAGVGFSSADQFIIDEISRLLPDCVSIKYRSKYDYKIVANQEYRGKKNPFNQDLISLGMKEKKSIDKFIPALYKTGSVQQKLALIQGLMDSDGYVTSGSTLEFASSSEQLALDFQELVWSIGGKATVFRSRSGYKNKDGNQIECNDSYLVRVQYHTPSDFVRLPRKKERCNDNGQYKNVGLPINNIVPFGSTDCTCIRVEHPRALFVIEDYVCTHNTFTVEKTLQSFGYTDGNGYLLNTGTVSPVALYTLLHKSNGTILLLDEADSALKDQDARNLLKSATDTKKVRKINWTKKSSSFVEPEEYEKMVEDNDGDPPDGVWPKYFEYTGKVIFISNLDIERLDPDGALRTRAFMIDINPTDQEVLDLMRKICMTFSLPDGYSLTEAERLEVIDVIGKSKSKQDINFRKLDRGLKIRATMGPGSGWEHFMEHYG